MNKYLFVSLFCVFLFCINSVADELETSEDLIKNQSVRDQLFDNISERLSRIESVLDKQAAVINKINEKLLKQEEMLLAMGKDSENRSTHRGLVKDPGTAVTSIEEKIATIHGTSDGTVKPDTEMPETQTSSGSEKGIFLKNVSLHSTGSSTRISGEIINRSYKDYTFAVFRIQLYDETDNLLKSIDVVSTIFYIGSTCELDELISDVDRESIARYVILFNDTELTTYQEEN